MGLRIQVPDSWANIGLPTGKSRFDVAAAAAQSVLPATAVVIPVASAAAASKSDDAVGSGDDQPGGATNASPKNAKPKKKRKKPKANKAGPETAPAADPPSIEAGELAGLAGSAETTPPSKDRWHVIRRYKLGTIALIVLGIGIAGILVGGMYWSDHVTSRIEKAAPVAKLPTKQIAGFNMAVPAPELQAKLQAITSQPITLTVGSFSETVGPETIKSWLQITNNKQKTEYYMHVNEAAINSSLTKLAEEYVRAPVNQVTVSEDGINRVVVGGRNGRSLSDPGTLKTQSKKQAKHVLDNKGMQFSTPLADVPFQSVTPAAFDKVLVANITTKKMWAFQGGQQINSFLISAGAPATPTPVGQFKVYSKLTIQDMRGNNADGTRYFQPRVPWVSYFYKDSAVHGVYWRPPSWFGAVNSSHGCIGLQVEQANWVFHWAPVGTTVIVHT